jgi:hypothetical protein
MHVDTAASHCCLYMLLLILPLVLLLLVLLLLLLYMVPILLCMLLLHLLRHLLASLLGHSTSSPRLPACKPRHITATATTHVKGTEYMT